MNFENTQYLSFLPAAILPLVIYLIFKKKPTRMLFSSVFLLKKISERVRIRTRLKDIILLIIRTLSISALILFFSGPFTGENSSFDPSKINVTAIYLDSSPSMADVSNNSDKFTNASQTALRTVAGSDNNGIFYIFTSDPERKFKGGRAEAVKFISETRIYGSERPFGDFLSQADSVLGGYSDANRLLLIFTDGRLNIDQDISTASEYFRRAVIFGSDITDDISIDSAFISGDNEITFSLASGVGNTSLDMFSDGQKIYSAPVEFKDNPVKKICINVPSAAERSILINGLIKDNANTTNNNYYFVISKSAEKKILIAGDPASAAVKSISALISAEKNTSLSGENYDTDDLASLRFEDYNAVFLTEIPAISSYLSSALNKYVSEGGSVFISAGGRFNMNDYSSNLAPQLALPQAEGYVNPQSSFFNAEITEPEHEIFRNVFDENFKGIGSVEVYNMYKFKALGWKVIMKAGGYPLLMEKKHGEGRIILMTSGLETSSSNIIENGIAVPLIFNTLLYLAGNKTAEGNVYTVGQKLKMETKFALVENSEQYYPGKHELSSEFIFKKEGFYKITDPEGSVLKTVAVNNQREKYGDSSDILLETFQDVLDWKGIGENTKLISPDKKLFSKHLLFLIFILAAADILIVRKM